MGTIDLYKVAAVVAVTGVASWIFSCETLFLLGFVMALAVAVVIGSLIGAMTLSERVSEEFAREKAAWRNVRAGTNISHR